MFLRKGGIYLQVHAELQPRRKTSIKLKLLKPICVPQKNIGGVFSRLFSKEILSV
jgi:hypothetical protein